VITIEGVRLDVRENGQIVGSDVVRDRWNAGSTAQPTYGFPGTPPSAIVCAVPEFIWGIPVELRHACQIQVHGFQYLNDD
jgi:hypothetical protein